MTNKAEEAIRRLLDLCDAADVVSRCSGRLTRFSTDTIRRAIIGEPDLVDRDDAA